MPSSLYKLRQKAFSRQEGHCYYCEYPMWLESWEEFAASFGISKAAAFHFRCTAEHLVARQDGGKDSRENIVAACWYCNITRHRFPTPPDPAIYRRHVMQLVRSEKWHPKELVHLFTLSRVMIKENAG
jgi:HNH endonuclease